MTEQQFRNLCSYLKSIEDQQYRFHRAAMVFLTAALLLLVLISVGVQSVAHHFGGF